MGKNQRAMFESDGTFVIGNIRYRNENGNAVAIGPATLTSAPTSRPVSRPANPSKPLRIELPPREPEPVARQTTLRVYGTIVPKERARTGKGWAFTPKRTREYAKVIKEAALKQNFPSLLSTVELELHIYLKLPTSLSKNKSQARIEIGHAQKPDIDNIEKAVLDALNGIAWVDDCQINSTRKTKQWTHEEEHILIIIRPSLPHPGPAVVPTVKK